MSAAQSSWRKALDTQMAQWRWTRSDMGQEILGVKWRETVREYNEDLRGVLNSMYSGEEAKLLGADPIFVSAEMCELVMAAANPEHDRPFQPEPLYVTDLPSPNGFMFFDQPFNVPDRFDRPVQIAAAAWQPMFSLRTEEERGSIDVETLMREWNETNEFAEGQRLGGIALSLYEPIGDDQAAKIRARGYSVPPLDMIHVTPWYFGMTFEGEEIDIHGVATGAGWWWRILQVSFRLMQQTLAHRQQERAQRHQRREMRRYAFPERETLVVRLRREKRDTEPGDTEPANYSHRFIVSGHWRNQFYPASQEHRQIWISPYVKGSEDLPLVIKPRRALVWTR